MQNSKHQNHKVNWGLISAAYAFLIVMMGTTLTPLYPIYSKVYDLSPLMITIIYAVYAAGVIGGLLVFGQLSDRRTPLCTYSRSDFICNQCASVLICYQCRFITCWTSDFRTVSGTFTSTATTTIVNLAADDKRAEPHKSSVNMLGLGFGPLLCGILAQYLPYAMRLVFIVDFILIIPAFIGIWFMPEPVKNKQKFKIEVQKLSVPSDIRSTFIYAVIPVFVGFSMLGLFTAISPNF